MCEYGCIHATVQIQKSEDKPWVFVVVFNLDWKRISFVCLTLQGFLLPLHLILCRNPELADGYCHAQFYMGCGDWNLHSYTCLASILPNVPHPHTLFPTGLQSFLSPVVPRLPFLLSFSFFWWEPICVYLQLMLVPGIPTVIWETNCICCSPRYKWCLSSTKSFSPLLLQPTGVFILKFLFIIEVFVCL